MCKRVKVGFLVAMAMLICLATASAQTERGEIIGTVKDVTGAVVPGAAVSITNLTSGINMRIVSNSEGIYQFPFLPYGTYRLKVAAKGFAPFEATKVEVVIASTTTVNVVLKLAATSQQVTVAANAIGLQASTSSVSTSIDPVLERNVPNLVNGSKRSAATYVDLSPGVDGGSIAGSRDNTADAELDGQTISARSRFYDYRPATPPSNNLPPVDAIGEFKTILNSMPAEYGRSSGGMTIFVTKSGTDQFHGAAYEYLRNQDFDARPTQAATRNIRKQNEFGFAAGGPVVLPKIYNGRGKTFIWGTLDGFRLRTAAASEVLSMPTEAMRNGDFSATGINPIYDSMNLYSGPNGQTERAQFSSNVIPANRESQVSKYFMGILPLPNLPGSFNNYVGSSTTYNNNWDATVKVDQYLTPSNHVSAFYQWSNPTTVNGSVLGYFYGNFSYEDYKRPRLEWSYSIKPNLVNDVVYGFTRYRYSAQQNNFGRDIGYLAGIRGTYDPNCPEIIFTTFSVCSASQANLPASQKGNLISTLNDTLAWSHGKHMVKTGLQFIRFNENFDTRGGTSKSSSAGSYSFDDTATANNGVGGNEFASFFLGYPTAVNLQAPTIRGLRQTYLGLFAQDDWRVTSRLTVNAGVRWDINVPYSEVHGQIADIDLNEPNPGADGRPGAMRYYGYGPGRAGTDRPGLIHWGDVGPRLGLAYLVSPKTVVRAFGGIIYQGAQDADAEYSNTSGFIGSGSPLANPNPYGTYYNWDLPYPQAVLGTVPNTNPAFRNGQSVIFSNPATVGTAPALYQWSAALEREIKGNIMVGATYLGTAMKHSVDNMPLDSLNPRYWTLGPLLNMPLNSSQVEAAGFTAPYPGFSTSLPLYEALGAYPQYNGLTDNANPWTSATYNAAVFKVQKRFSSGLTLLAHYTWSKNIASWTSAPGQFGATPRDPYNLGLNKALAEFDIPQSLVIIYSYQLPFGPGSRLGRDIGRVGRTLLGGWTISGFQSYQDGTPAHTSGALATPLPTIASTANRIANVPVRSAISCSDLEFDAPGRDFMWNAGSPSQVTVSRPLAFMSEGNYGLGNVPIYDPHARECGTENEALSLVRAFAIHENVRIEIGADAYNIFNRHTWITSSDNITSPNFGIVQPYQGNGQGESGPRQLQLHVRVEF